MHQPRLTADVVPAAPRLDRLDEQTRVARMRADDVVLGKEAAVGMEQEHAYATPMPVEPFTKQALAARGRIDLQLKLGAEHIDACERVSIEANPAGLSTQRPTERLGQRKTVFKPFFQCVHAAK